MGLYACLHDDIYRAEGGGKVLSSTDVEQMISRVNLICMWHVRLEFILNDGQRRECGLLIFDKLDGDAGRSLLL